MPIVDSFHYIGAQLTQISSGGFYARFFFGIEDDEMPAVYRIAKANHTDRS